MNDNIVLTEEIGKYRIDIIQDIYPVNPRDDYDHLGTIISFSKKYNLSDKNLDSELLDFKKKFLPFVHNEKCIMLPIYLLNHSGIQINTTGFNDKYDSGGIGYIFVTKEKIIKEWGKLDAEVEKQVLKCLECEIKEYNYYLCGECYGYSITIQDEEFEEEYESCYGFYGTPEEILEFVISDNEELFKGESK